MASQTEMVVPRPARQEHQGSRRWRVAGAVIMLMGLVAVTATFQHLSSPEGAQASSLSEVWVLEPLHRRVARAVLGRQQLRQLSIQQVYAPFAMDY